MIPAPRTLLIDGDIFIYRAAAAAEKPVKWDDDLWTLHAFEEPAKAHLDDMLAGLVETLNGNRMIVALTDGTNWRKSVLPTYKQNRANVRRPMLLQVLREYVLEHYETFLRPTLEADDILGILGTHPRIIEGEKIIVSIDKDLLTIPGWHYNVNHPDEGVFEVSEDTAAYWHLYQTLIGDTTDGYSGCPGVGPVAAKEFLANPVVYRKEISTFKSGPRKGESKETWVSEPTDDVWKGVESLYAKAGLGPEVALEQARVARICHASDYNFTTKSVILWRP